MILNTLNKQALVYANLVQVGVTAARQLGNNAKIANRLNSQDVADILESRIQMRLNQKAEGANK